jgi:hypothetical protein
MTARNLNITLFFVVEGVKEDVENDIAGTKTKYNLTQTILIKYVLTD